MHKHNQSKSKQSSNSLAATDIIPYNFSGSSGQQDVADFLFSMGIDGNLSSTHSREPLDMKKNFYTMLSNFQKFMAYANINEKWQRNTSSNPSIMTTSFIQKIKLHIKLLLTEGILSNKHNNLIFEFNGHKPFVENMGTAYKLLLNATTSISPKTENHIEQVLSQCLLHAATCNNSTAIEILLSDYHASPIKVWPAINVRTNQQALTTMPILRITKLYDAGVDREILDISWDEQEHNFILMLNSIDFSLASTEVWHTQEIFREAFKNEFISALENLLAKEAFCRKLDLTNEDLIMIAFRYVAVPRYKHLVERMLNNNNLFKDKSSEEDTVQSNDSKRLITYIDILKTILASKVDSKKFHDTSLKIAFDFIEFLLTKNPEYNAIIGLVMATQRAQDKLSKENSKLFQTQLILEETIETLQKNLINFKTEHAKLIGAKTAELTLSVVETQNLQNKLGESEVKRKKVEDKFEDLGDKHNKLKQKLKEQQEACETIHSKGSQDTLFQPNAIEDTKQRHKLHHEIKHLKEENLRLKELLQNQTQMFDYRRQAGIYRAKEREAILKKQHHELQIKSDELMTAKLELQQFTTNKQLSTEETEEFQQYMSFKLERQFDTTQDLQNFVEYLENELAKFRFNKKNDLRSNVRPRALSI